MAETPSMREELPSADSQTPTPRPMDSRRMVAAARKEVRLAERASRRDDGDGRSSRSAKPARTIGTLAAVLALTAGIAIPAYAATQVDGGGATQASISVREQAEDEAQGFTAGGEAAVLDLASTTYGATSVEEIERVKAEEEALERAREAQKMQAELEEARLAEAAAAPAAAEQAVEGAPAEAAPVEQAAAPAVSGGWTTPLPGGTYTLGDGLGTPRSHGPHQGVDLLAPQGTPIYAAQDCVVAYAGASGGFGNLVELDCNVDGQQVTIKNGHIMDGGIAVGQGQQVAAGEVIAYVGSTGWSTANHLHIEVWINGGLADPAAYIPM